MRPRRLGRFGWIAAALAAAWPAIGASLTPDEAEAAELIAELGSPTLSSREAAMNGLIMTEAPVERVAESMLAEGALTPEQASRLETALEARFGQRPRAALGIGFAGNSPTAAIVDRVLPEFPAKDFLQVNDMIVEVDGRDVRQHVGQRTVRASILAHEPGENIQMTLLRGGQTVRVRVPLGSFDRLDNPGQPDSETLREAWQIRRGWMGFDRLDDPVIDCVGGPMRPRGGLPARAVPDLEAGGCPDNGVAMRQELQAALGGVARTAMRRENRGAAEQPRLEARQPDTGLKQQQSALRERLAVIEQSAEMLRVRLRTLAENDPSRDEVQQLIRLREAEAIMLREQIERLANAGARRDERR